MDEDEKEVTEEQKQRDLKYSRFANKQRRLIREANEAAINKLPNELRDTFRDWNPYIEDY